MHCDRERRAVNENFTPTIAQAFRLALQTGFLHKGLAPLGGDELLMTETNNEVWRELIGAVMTVLERRRNRNAYFAMRSCRR